MQTRKKLAVLSAVAVVTTLSWVPSQPVWAEEEGPLDSESSTLEVVDYGDGIFDVIPWTQEPVTPSDGVPVAGAAPAWTQPISHQRPDGFPEPPTSPKLEAYAVSLKVTAPSNSAPITTAKPTFSGTGATPNMWVVVTSHDEQVTYCEVKAAGNGTWSCAAQISLPNGLHRLAVQDYGNWENRVEYVVRISASTAVLAVQAPVQDQVVTTNRPTFSGVGVNGYSLRVEDINGNTLCSTTVANSQWSCQSTPALAEGPGNAYVVTWANGVTSWAAVNFVVDASASKATFAHTFDVVVASNPGESANWLSQSTIQGVLDTLETKYSTWTSQTWSADIVNFQEAELNNICGSSGTSQDALWTEAASLFGHNQNYYTASTGKHLLILENAPRDCSSYSAQGYANLTSEPSPYPGGIITVRWDASIPVYMTSTVIHEFGHNLGWEHSNTEVCTPKANGTGTWAQSNNSATCYTREYADAWDVMGSSSQYELMAARVFSAHVLGRGPSLTVADVGASNVSVTLAAAPVGAGTGVQSLIVRDMYPSASDPHAGWDFVFELRKNLAGSGTLGVAVTRTDGAQSILLKKATAGVSAGPGPTQVAYLAAGDTFSSYSGSVSVTVTTVNSTQAVLSVTRTAPNASLATPTILGFGDLGATLTATVASRTPSDAQLSYQWYRGASPIADAVNPTYQVAPADLGNELTVRVVAAAAGYTAVASTSNGLWAVSNGLYRFYNSATGAHFYTGDPGERDYIVGNLHQFSIEGAAGRIVPGQSVSASNQVVVHRFYLPGVGVHFYSSDPDEIAYVKAHLSAKYSYEGASYVAYTRTANEQGCVEPGTIPFYRFYNHNTGVHFYTADPDEKAYVVNTYDYASGKGAYELESIAYCILPK
ncbi:MAG: hypothetical protein LBM94_05405 [Propionibacteriaceae bacterium]|jgi:hypothetical protein|nr:hypothetical protein [Propionibacteriaceae bacterium]